MVFPYCIAQVIGGFFGAVPVYFCYVDHFKASVSKIDPVKIRNNFSTTPAIRNLPRNFFVEFLATFIFISGMIGITKRENPAVEPIAVGL